MGVGHDAGVGPGLMAWYMDIPLVSRLYLTGAFLSTAACAVDIITPFSLYFNWTLVMQGQVWRLITAYLYFGLFSVDFLFHMYFLVSPSTVCALGGNRKIAVFTSCILHNLFVVSLYFCRYDTADC